MVREEKFNRNLTKRTLFLSGTGTFLMNERTELKLQREEIQAIQNWWTKMAEVEVALDKHSMRAGHSTDSPVLAQGAGHCCSEQKIRMGKTLEAAG